MKNSDRISIDDCLTALDNLLSGKVVRANGNNIKLFSGGYVADIKDGEIMRINSSYTNQGHNEEFEVIPNRFRNELSISRFGCPDRIYSNTQDLNIGDFFKDIFTKFTIL